MRRRQDGSAESLETLQDDRDDNIISMTPRLAASISATRAGSLAPDPAKSGNGRRRPVTRAAGTADAIP